MARQIRSEQASAVLASLRSSIPLGCLVAGSVGIVLHGECAAGRVAAWLTAVIAVNVARLVVAWRFSRPLTSERDSARFLSTANVGAVVSGLTWSAVPIVFMGTNDALSTNLIFVIAGITAGATVLGAAYATSSLLFSLPILIPTVVRVAMGGTLSSDILALDIALYIGLLIRASTQSQAAFCAACRLKHEAILATVQLHRLANHDPLTDLLNRAGFSAALGQWRDAFRDEGRSFSLVLLDLDHFKSINDTLGHKAGDEVLMAVADRLKRAVSTDDVVGRLGGDEFAILFANGPGAGDARAAVERIVAVASGPLHIDGRRIDVAVSAGSAAIPGDCGSPDDLLSYADLALYAAKDAGRHCARPFEPAMRDAARMARDIEQDLARAIADRVLEVWYQPQVHLDSGRLVGLEALIRWHHPVHGWVPPPLVVAAARRIHASRSLTGFVIEEACGRLRQLARDGQHDVIVGINVSPGEIGHYDLERLLTRALAAQGVDPRRFEVEITEEALLASDAALATLKSLSARGVRLAIDDFGTGCSSIAYLRRLRVDRIKIDRCFVTGFDTREDDRILVQTIIGIGRSFGIEVVAEGVETDAEASLLRRFGCAIGQGFHFGRPARFDDTGVAAIDMSCRPGHWAA